MNLMVAAAIAILSLLLPLTPSTLPPTLLQACFSNPGSGGSRSSGGKQGIPSNLLPEVTTSVGYFSWAAQLMALKKIQ